MRVFHLELRQLIHWQLVFHLTKETVAHPLLLLLVQFPGMPQGVKRKTPLKFGHLSASGVTPLGKKFKLDSGDGAKGAGRPAIREKVPHFPIRLLLIPGPV